MDTPSSGQYAVSKAGMASVFQASKEHRMGVQLMVAQAIMQMDSKTPFDEALKIADVAIKAVVGM